MRTCPIRVLGETLPMKSVPNACSGPKSDIGVVDDGRKVRCDLGAITHGLGSAKVVVVTTLDLQRSTTAVRGIGRALSRAKDRARSRCAAERMETRAAQGDSDGGLIARGGSNVFLPGAPSTWSAPCLRFPCCRGRLPKRMMCQVAGPFALMRLGRSGSRGER